jgi:co-chaperonin GroES (HSP10)
VCAGAYAHKTAVVADPAGVPHFPVLRSRFTAGAAVKKATLRVLGLGFFHCYINGKEVTEDAFLPLNSDFEPRDNYPIEEVLTGHRIYVPEFDVLPYLKEGGTVVVSNTAVKPVTDALSKTDYDGQVMLDYLTRQNVRLVVVDGEELIIVRQSDILAIVD